MVPFLQATYCGNVRFCLRFRKACALWNAVPASVYRDERSGDRQHVLDGRSFALIVRFVDMRWRSSSVMSKSSDSDGNDAAVSLRVVRGRESAPDSGAPPNFKVKASGSDLGRLDV